MTPVSAARPHSGLFLCNTSDNFHQRASTGPCTLHLSLGHSCGCQPRNTRARAGGRESSELQQTLFISNLYGQSDGFCHIHVWNHLITKKSLWYKIILSSSGPGPRSVPGQVKTLRSGPGLYIKFGVPLPTRPHTHNQTFLGLRATPKGTSEETSNRTWKGTSWQRV